MIENIYSNPIKTWKTDIGDLNLFFENDTLQFDFKSADKIEEIALESIKGMPKEALQTKNCSVEIISQLFQKCYPKILQKENAPPSIQFVDNCFEGMKLSILLPKATMTIGVSPNETIGEVAEKIQLKGKISKEKSLSIFHEGNRLTENATLISLEIPNGATLQVKKIKESLENKEKTIEEKAIYHNVDSRINPCEFTKRKIFPEFALAIKKQTESVACMIEKSNFIEDKQKKTYTLFKENSLAQYVESIMRYHPFGEEENFYNEPVQASWTGFLVEKTTLLTAAHCICDQKSKEQLPLSELASMRIVFGFQMTENENYKKIFEEKDVYQIKRVIKYSWSRGKTFSDWALLELDREVQGRVPLKLDFSTIDSGHLYMLGHPTGLPLKFAGQAKVISAVNPDVFESDLCAFKGNSGSPVFRTDTKEVVGMLVAGNSDFTIDFDYKGKEKTRSRVHCIPSVRKGAEICQRVSVLESVKKIINKKLNLKTPQEGLNFPSECSSIGCSTFGEVSYIHKGLGAFDLGREFYQSLCGYCEKSPVMINSIVMKNCQFKYVGIDPNKKKIEKEEKTENSSSLTLEKWKFFKVEVKKLNN